MTHDKTTAIVLPRLLSCLGVILLTWLSAGCELQPRPPLRQTQKFAEVYLALLVAAAQDSLSPAQADSVLQAHNYSRSEFDEAVRYYSEHAEAWALVLKEVVARLDSQSLAPPAPQRPDDNRQ